MTLLSTTHCAICSKEFRDNQKVAKLKWKSDSGKFMETLLRACLKCANECWQEDMTIEMSQKIENRLSS